MQILLTGLDHKTASLELRERVAFTADQLSDALPRLGASVGEAVIVSTCNRTEVYTTADEPEEASALVRRSWPTTTASTARRPWRGFATWWTQTPWGTCSASRAGSTR